MQEESQSFTQTNQSFLSDFPMMSEEEAQEMIQTYNMTIEHILKENHDMKDKLLELQNTHKEVQAKNLALKANYIVEQKRAPQLEKIDNQIQNELQIILQCSSLSQYKDIIEQEIMLAQQLTVQAPQSQSQNSQELIILEADDSQQPEVLNQSDATIEFLLSKVLPQLKEIAMINAKQSVDKSCSQCHKDYNPKINHPDSCLFHSGKMKFYSCKQCGADDYFTCCLKCSKCCQGCKYNYHVPRP